MPRYVKHSRQLQISESKSIDIEGWLAYNITLIGSVPVRIGNSTKLEVTEDSTCLDSDGIPFGPGNKLEINFDATDGEKRIAIEYLIVECCE
ncbi:MAG: hypothetical protein K9H61_02295 [Bacteroidia bacterium]|nr:hypothetical protein [Bacteroidia bacterium]MCF8445801.1 hypothetical protein [Bacteroidia bacterium]